MKKISNGLSRQMNPLTKKYIQNDTYTGEIQDMMTLIFGLMV